MQVPPGTYRRLREGPGFSTVCGRVYERQSCPDLKGQEGFSWHSHYLRYGASEPGGRWYELNPGKGQRVTCLESGARVDPLVGVELGKIQPQFSWNPTSIWGLKNAQMQEKLGENKRPIQNQWARDPYQSLLSI